MQEMARFRFKYIGGDDIGVIWRPYALVDFKTKVNGDWLPIEMVVDSGADYSLLPKRYAVLLGIDVEVDCTPKTTLGVGGSETVYLYKNQEIKIVDWQKKVPIGFLERDDVPPLLGRLGFMEVLKTVLFKHQTIFEK